jgi:hypothetical protein
LSKSTADDFVVLVRQIPIQNSRAVAINQAMATKIGGRRVTIDSRTAPSSFASTRHRDGRPARGQRRIDHAID